MKINNPSPELTAPVDLSKPVDDVSTDSVRPSPRPAISTNADEVSLSSNLRLADEAIRAASVSSEIRPAAVARVRAKLDLGTLGNDLDRLAGKVLDALDQTRVDRP